MDNLKNEKYVNDFMNDLSQLMHKYANITLYLDSEMTEGMEYLGADITPDYRNKFLKYPYIVNADSFSLCDGNE